MSDIDQSELAERNRALEERLRQLESQAAMRERLFTLSLEMLCVAGCDGYFKQVNPAFERTLGIPEADLLARPIVEFVHPQDRQRTLDEIRKLASGIPTVQFENRYLCPGGCHQGQCRWLAWTAMPHEGLIYATASDVTARKRAEEHFRLLLESAPDGMVIVDEQGRIALVNAQAERLFGYGREEIVGQPVEMLLPDRYRLVHRRQRNGFAQEPHARPMGSRPDLAARRKDGSEFLSEISLSPIESEDGMLIACAIRDVTERRRGERALRENAVQLMAAQRIQEYLLPRKSPLLPGFDIAGASFPAEFAAGDQFEYLPMAGDCLGLVVGDVSGHGFSSALLMAVNHAYLRAMAAMRHSMQSILAFANDALLQEIEENRFITLFFGRLDPRQRVLTYVSAGHPTGYVLGGDGRLKHRLESTTLPLGVLSGIEFPEGPLVRFQSGDLLLLVTDGILESRQAGDKDKFFGSDRTIEAIRACRHLPAGEIVQRLYQTVRAFSGGEQQEDDITLIVAKALD